MTFQNAIQCPPYLLARSTAARTLRSIICLALLAQVSFGQSTDSASNAKKESGEVWVGWLETKAQNLRLILRLSSSADSSPSGSITSPDQTPDALPITQASVQGGRLEFAVNPPGIGSARLAVHP